MASKDKLRHRCKQARLDLSQEEVVTKSSAIVRRLKRQLKHADLTAIHCYEPIKKIKEVNITPFIDDLLSRQPNLLVYTSRIVDGYWQVVSLTGQIVHGKPQYDLIIIPMLGFDETSLHRLGNGGGYYDKLLSDQTEARKIGVCFEVGKLTHFVAEPHDVALDYIVTEQQTYSLITP